MAATTTASILFATNRKLAGEVGGIATFDDNAQDMTPEALFCGSAEVCDIDISSPDHGTIDKMSKLTTGGFDDGAIAALADSKNDVLVFVHGASNSFEDAITRGAYNKLWLASAQLPNCNFDVVAFTWPARTYTYWDVFSDVDGYRHDQQQAAASAYHFGLFLKQVDRIRAAIGPTRKLNLLCHSMGNYMLGGAVEAWSRANPAQSIFDTAVLAAADEVATTFTTPDNGRLCTLKALARNITVYFNYDDVLMHLSHIANCDYRLGYDGPPNKADQTVFARSVYSMVDCTGVDDYISTILEQPDRSHQYYRQSPTVRFDIAQTLTGVTMRRPRYDEKANVYSLFAQPQSL
jgi:esterase/lipase superfamily enzyme